MSTLDQAGEILDQNFLNSRTLAPAAVGSQVALMTIVSIATIIFFNVLRPTNKVIYEPKVRFHLDDKCPPRISDGLFGWLPPLIHTHEPVLLDKIGLDAVAFLRFLRLLRWLFTVIAVITCAVLIPVNVSFNLKNVSSRRRDPLSMLTVRDVSGNWLFFHVAASYVVTFLVCGFIYVHWSHMLRLRNQWFRSPEYIQSFYARTLAIRHVPKQYQSDEGLGVIFSGLNVPYPTTSVHIGRRVGKLPELIEYHNRTVREFEKILVRYLKGGRIASKRPKIRFGAFLGIFGGTTKDAIDFYTAKLKRTEAAIENYRTEIDTRKAENYGFASMAAVPYAHIVARLLHGKTAKSTTIELAPNPKDIIWDNMNKSDSELVHKKVLGFLYLAVVCFFNTLPLVVISILASLSSLRYSVPFLRRWAESSPTSFAFVAGVLPPAVFALFGWVLPHIMRWLSRYQGALTHSRLDRAVVARYFFFLVFSQLVIFTLLGVLFNSVKEIVLQIGQGKKFSEILKQLNRLPQDVHKTYVDQSSFWLTFFPLRGFLVVFDLAQILNLIYLSLKTRLFGRTPRDIREWTQPPEFEYAVYYSNMLFMACVALVFSPLAPVVAVAAAIVFWISSFVYKYQLMFVFVSKVESGGRMWNVVINRMLASVILMQLLMILTVGLQFTFRSLIWLCTIPPILIIIAFKLYITRKFDRPFRYYIPSEEELRAAKVHSQRADNTGHRLEKRFGHPALYADLFTPMLHAKMVPLLAEVYKGRLGESTKAKLDEYGGQRLSAQIVEGGVKIAAIDQANLEYDLALYQRDRGELDWDRRSFASTNVLGSDAASLAPGMYGEGPDGAPGGGRNSPVPGYERYMAAGPTGAPAVMRGGSEMEMAALLAPQHQNEPGDFDPRYLAQQQQQQQLAMQRQGSPAPSLMYQRPSSMQQLVPPHQQQQGQQGWQGPPRTHSPAPSMPPQYVGQPAREAPLHRPYTPQQQPPPQPGHGRQASGFSVYNDPPRPASQQGMYPPQQQQFYQQGHSPSWSSGGGGGRGR